MAQRLPSVDVESHGIFSEIPIVDEDTNVSGVPGVDIRGGDFSCGQRWSLVERLCGIWGYHAGAEYSNSMEE